MKDSTLLNAKFSALRDGAVWQTGDAPLVYEPVALGKGDFTVSLRARWTGEEFGSGGLISQFDEEERRGFTLGVTSLGAACEAQAHRLKLAFGIDAGTEPNWVDCGNLGGKAVFPFALCEYKGAMYVGIYTGGPGVGGGVSL